MDAEAVLASAGDQLAQEQDLAVLLAHAHVGVVDPGESVRHAVEFVVMGGEQRLGAALRVLVQELGDGPRDADAVVRARAPADFIEQDERAVRQVVQDGRGFVHLHHERRFAGTEVIRGAHAGEDLVDEPHPHRAGRHIAAHLRHEGDERRLPEQGTFSGHVGAGDHEDLLVVPIERDVVGHIGFPVGQTPLDDRMATADDFEFVALHEDGPGVAVVLGDFGEAEQEVKAGYGAGRGLQQGQVRVQGRDKGRVGFPLDHVEPLLRAEDALLEFLELRSDVALGLRQRLLADPVLGHLVLVGVADFEVIPEDVVERNLQRGDARGFGFALADALEFGLAVVPEVAQLIEFLDHPGGDGGSLAQHARWILGQLGPQLGEGRIRRVEPPGPAADHRVVRAVDHEAQGLHGGQRAAQAVELGWGDADGGGLGQQPFEVPDAVELGDEVGPHVRLLEEGGHRLMPAGHALGVTQGLGDPPAEHPGPHRGGGAVEDVDERHTLRVGRGEQLEVADGEPVHGHVAAPFHAAERGDVPEAVVLRGADVVQCSSGRNDGERLTVQAESLEAFRAEVALQRLAGEVGLPHPVIEREAVTRQLEGLRFAVTQVKGFLGAEGPQEWSDVGGSALRGQELSRRDVEEGDSSAFPLGWSTALEHNVDGGEPVVFPRVEDLVVEGHTGRDHFGDPALDDGLGGLGVLELVTNRHTVAGPDELGQVVLEGVVRESGEFNLGGGAVLPGGQHDVEHLGRGHGILSERFVEIAHTKEQQGIRMLGLDLVVLGHQGGLLHPLRGFPSAFGPGHGVRRRPSVVPCRSRRTAGARIPRSPAVLPRLPSRAARTWRR